MDLIIAVFARIGRPGGKAYLCRMANALPAAYTDFDKRSSMTKRGNRGFVIIHR
jgi:hypothetical protein